MPAIEVRPVYIRKLAYDAREAMLQYIGSNIRFLGRGQQRFRSDCTYVSTEQRVYFGYH